MLTSEIDPGSGAVTSRTPTLSDDPIVLLQLGDLDYPTHPFTKEIMRANISRRFEMSAIKTYEGIGDLENHIRTFSNALLLQPVSDALKCRPSSQTLEGQAQRWYNRLPPNSIASLKQLNRAFIGHLISGKTHENSSTSLMSIEHDKNKSLRTYIDRFTKEALKVPDLDEKVVMIALQQGTTDVYFKMSLAKQAPQDMNQLQKRADKYIKAEESMKKSHPQPDNDKKRKSSNYNARDKFQRVENFEESTPRKLGTKFAKYARLKAPRSQILMDIEKDKDLKWPRPLKSDPEKRNQNLFCRYHKEVGHNTDDCIQLKNEIEYLIRQGKLNKYTKDGNNDKWDNRDNQNNRDNNDKRPQPRGLVVNIILEGPTAAGTTSNSRKAYAREVLQIVGGPPKKGQNMSDNLL